jgi:hypothetical protein
VKLRMPTRLRYGEGRVGQGSNRYQHLSRSAGVVGTARRNGGSGNRGRPAAGEGRPPLLRECQSHHAKRSSARLHDPRVAAASPARINPPSNPTTRDARDSLAELQLNKLFSRQSVPCNRGVNCVIESHVGCLNDRDTTLDAGDRFGASLPRNAASASWKSPVDTPQVENRQHCVEALGPPRPLRQDR